MANNVVAHVPDLNDFLSGLAALLARGATLSLEFHHLLRLVEGGQFDTIYHEHFQYLSLASLTTALERHGLQVVDVEELTTQGGSLRVYARRAGPDPAAPSPRGHRGPGQGGRGAPDGSRDIPRARPGARTSSGRRCWRSSST